MAHTPGPWKTRPTTRRTSKSDWVDVVTQITNEYGTHVGVICTYIHPDNGNVIAAAPEMEKALEAEDIAEANDRGDGDVLDRMEAIGEHEAYIDGRDLHEWARELRRVAVAKAKGRA